MAKGDKVTCQRWRIEETKKFPDDTPLYVLGDVCCDAPTIEKVDA